MKITFTQDHQSPYSGNSFYTAGTTADLQHGAELVALGVAREGWGAAPVAPGYVEEEVSKPLTPLTPRAEIPVNPTKADTKRPRSKTPLAAAKRRAE